MMYIYVIKQASGALLMIYILLLMMPHPAAAYPSAYVSGKKHDYKECTQLQQLEWLDCGNAVPTVAATVRSRWC